MAAKGKAAPAKTIARKPRALTKPPAKRKPARAGMTRHLKWRVSRPHRSAFAGVTGDAKEYRVRILDVTATDDARVRESVVEVFTMTLKLADRNLTHQRRFVLFVWDTVYAKLTVTFTDPRRHNEGPDVLKLSCSGWDAELQKLSDRKALAKGDALGSRMFDWIEACVGQADELVALLSRALGFKITFAFSDDVEGTSYQRL